MIVIKHLSTILTGVAVVGTGITAWAGYKFGRKMERENIDLSKLENWKVAAPDFIKGPGITTLATSAAIIGAHATNMKTIGALGAAAAGAMEVSNRFEKGVREIVTPEQFEEIQKNVGKQIAENAPLVAQNTANATGLYEGESIYVLEWGPRVKFKATDTQILKAELDIDKLYIKNGEATLADYARLLPNVKPTVDDETIGWTNDSCCSSMINFYYVKFKLDSGEPATMICVDKRQLTLLYDDETGMRLL